MPSTRPTLYGSRHAVSAGHYLAAAAGFAILEAGGNAIDAGCAAGIALAVLHPDEVNVAGVAPIMIRTGQPGKVVTIAGLGHWPKRLPADLFMREHGGKMPLGILRTVVPAAPDAWITALTDYGTMSFGDVAGAAVRYAREGFAVFEYMATMIKQYEDGYRSWPSNAAIFLPGGKLPQVGDRFVQSDLAGTLQYMIDQERAAATKHGRLAGLAAARAAFYCGDIAETIVRYHEAERRLPRARRPRQLPQPLRGAGAGALARLRGLHLRSVVPGPDAGPGAAHDRGGRRLEGASRTTAPTTSISSPRS